MTSLVSFLKVLVNVNLIHLSLEQGKRSNPPTKGLLESSTLKTDKQDKILPIFFFSKIKQTPAQCFKITFSQHRKKDLHQAGNKIGNYSKVPFPFDGFLENLPASESNGVLHWQKGQHHNPSNHSNHNLYFCSSVPSTEN